MKTLINKILVLLCLICYSSCNYLDIVPDEKATEKDAFANPQAALRYLYSCYAYMPNPRNSTKSIDWMTGDDIVTPFNETFATFASGNYTPTTPSISYWNDLYKGIRQCYLLKDNVASVPGLTADLQAAYTAEADFLIAYYHFLLIRMYGPVILIKEQIDLNSLDTPEMFLARSPYDECVNWVADKFKAVGSEGSALPLRWTGEDYGRATRIAAMAIRARLLLYAASPQFNGGDKFKSLYGRFTNHDGVQLIGTNYNEQKWKDAASAYNEVITMAKNENYDLYHAVKGGLNTTPEPTDLTQRSLRFTFMDKDNTPEVIWAHCEQEDGAWPVQAKSLPLFSGKAWGGVAPTLLQIERFYTKNGLPIDVDPDFKNKDLYSIASFPANDPNGEGETLLMNLNREPRFYAWIAFHNGYYEVSGEDKSATSPNSYASKWKRGINNAKQLVQFTKLSNAGMPQSNKDGSKTGYLNKKSAHPGTSISSTGVTTVQYPWPMVRLGELYLGYAEACIESGDLVNGKKYIDEIRLRAGIPKVEEAWAKIGVTLDKDKLREIVHQERLIELYMENHNFWDIRRWGVAETLGKKPMGLSIQEMELAKFAKPIQVDVSRRFIPAHYLMPIPIEEINNNPNLVQNPGYDE